MDIVEPSEKGTFQIVLIMDLMNAHFRTMTDADAKQLFIAFVKMVRSMRDKQKEFFQTRNMNVLRDAKKLEKDVDGTVVGLFSDEQMQLF